MKSRTATNNIHILFSRLLLTAAILIPGMAAICLSWTPVASVHASSREGAHAGATLFHKNGCERCHGIDGVGTPKGPDLRTIGKRWKKSQIEHQIIYGGYEMPPFQDALQQDEVKSLVAYLSLKRKLPKNH